MEKRKNKVPVPKDMFERIVLEAIDTGKLQNYLFDNEKLLTHAILRRFLGVIMSLKPAKRMMANKQLQSRFLNALTKKVPYFVGRLAWLDISTSVNMPGSLTNLLFISAKIYLLNSQAISI